MNLASHPKPTARGPRTLPPGIRIAPPALRSPDARLGGPPIPDISFSGGGPVVVNGLVEQIAPEDAAVAVGNGYVLAADNDQITIHSTSGTSYPSHSEVVFWKPVAGGDLLTDPSVQYLDENKQFYFAIADDSPPPNKVYTWQPPRPPIPPGAGTCSHFRAARTARFRTSRS